MSRARWIWTGVLLFAVLAAYGNVYDNQFLLDDEFLHQKNVFIRDWSYLPRIFVSSSTMGAGGEDSFYRPLQTLSYLLVHQAFGLSEPAFHALNVGLHGINVLLIFFLGLRWGARETAIGVLALLWAVHPVHTEAVTYMSATADPLHTLFILAGLHFVGRVGWAALFFALGLLSKESAIVFPTLYMALIFARSERPWRPRTYLGSWPLWVIAGLYLAARKTVLNFDDTFSFYTAPNVYTENIHYRFFTFLATVPDYTRLLFWPSGLHMERAFPVYPTLFSLKPAVGLGLLLIAGFIIWCERGRAIRAGSLAVLWAAFAHVPHTGVLLPVNSLFLEHWLYLPSLGLVMGGGLWLDQRVRRLGRVLVFALPTAVGLGSLTFRQNRVWANPIAFYGNILKYNPGTVRLHNNLGMAYGAVGDRARAMEHYRLAIAIDDNWPQVRHNLGEEYMHLGDWNEALNQFLRAIQINPRFYHSYKNLAIVHDRLGDRRKSDEAYQNYLRLRPDLSQ